MIYTTMNKRYNIYTLFAATLWLTLGCNTDHGGNMPQRDVELHFTAATVSDGTTRVDAGDAYNDALPSGSAIGVYIYGYEGSTGYDLSTLQPAANTPSTTWVYTTVGSAGTVTENNETFKVSNLVLTSHEKAPKYPQKVSGSGSGDMDNVKIFAVFPNNPDFTPSGTYYDFTANLDQTTEANIKGSDLMTNDLTTYGKEDVEHKSLRLILKHRMAKVHVNFIPKAGSDLTAANMPTTFKVLGVYRSLRINPKEGTFGTNTEVAKTTDGTGTALIGANGQSFFIAPQEISVGTPWLKFDIRGSGQFKGISGCTFTPTSVVTLEAGKCYQVNVTVDVDFVSATGTITTWNQETMSYDTVVL